MRFAPESAKMTFQRQNFDFFAPESAKIAFQRQNSEFLASEDAKKHLATARDFVRYSSRLFPFSCIYKSLILIRSNACTSVSERILL